MYSEKIRVRALKVVTQAVGTGEEQCPTDEQRVPTKHKH